MRKRAKAPAQHPAAVFAIDNVRTVDGVTRTRRWSLLFATRELADAECERLRADGCDGEFKLWQIRHESEREPPAWSQPVVMPDGTILPAAVAAAPFRRVPIIGDVDSETGNVTLRPGCRFPGADMETPR